MAVNFPQDIIDRMYKTGVFAVLVIDKIEDAIPLADALLEGGVDIIELTLRTPVAVDALKEIKSKFPEMLAGIGTVITKEQVKQVVASGAAFGVAPGLNPEIVTKAQKLGLPFGPGVMTPSDVEKSVSLGCKILKFFPAEPAGGITYLKSMSSPYSHLNLKYLPLGGLNERNLRSYLELSSVLAVGGSWIAKREMIKNNDWKIIKENAQKARKLVDEIRGA